ncbi:hypothetical protein BFF93_06755 [Elizabethkingia meningoseptica]|nr:hypothetical protein BFF93_06755 [Elizabethkingia meningoseptica]
MASRTSRRCNKYRAKIRFYSGLGGIDGADIYHLWQFFIVKGIGKLFLGYSRFINCEIYNKKRTAGKVVL